MQPEVTVGNRRIGPGHPVFIVAEIGINHNGDMAIAKKLIDVAAAAGVDAVKFQKRDPDTCVPEDQKQVMRKTPWGVIPYIEYRRHLEFDLEQYAEIDRYCRQKPIMWFASCWDLPSLEFMDIFDPVCHKVASATLTDDELLTAMDERGKPIILSTGMSTWEEIERAVSLIRHSPLIITHNTSTYPCPPQELNLRMITTLKNNFDCPIGYSGHEIGLQTTYAAVALGVNLVERHITLDRNMWGSDHQASVESTGLFRLVRDIRIIEAALGDGVKRIYASEQASMLRLRRKKCCPALN